MTRHMLISEENNILTFTIVPTDTTIDIDVSDSKFQEMTENGYGNYKYENGKIIYRQDNIDKASLYEELIEIKQWFSINDYIPNKIITNEWETTDQRWIDYLSGRTIKRNRQDEINNLL